VVVYYKGERMGEARLLDPVANDRKPETRIQRPDLGAQNPGSEKPNFLTEVQP
jgi:hypothetical protein